MPDACPECGSTDVETRTAPVRHPGLGEARKHTCQDCGWWDVDHHA